MHIETAQIFHLFFISIKIDSSVENRVLRIFCISLRAILFDNKFGVDIIDRHCAETLQNRLPEQKRSLLVVYDRRIDITKNSITNFDFP